MAFMKESDARFLGLKRKTGFFFAAALALMALTIAFIGIRREVFTPKVDVYFTAPTGDNIIEGMEVKFKGFIIGRVEGLNLDEHGRVDVAMSINRHYIKFVRQDSLAKLSQVGLIGDYFVDIGEGNEPVVSDGWFLGFERDVSLADIAENVKDQFDDIIAEIRKVADNVVSPEGSFNQSLNNVRVLTEELVKTNRNLDEMITAVRNDILPEVRRAASNSGDLTGTADRMLKDMEDKIHHSLENIEEVTRDLEAASSQVPGVVRDTKEITEALKGVWPISGGIVLPKERALDIDSDR